jgi:hypothetical protein
MDTFERLFKRVSASRRGMRRGQKLPDSAAALMLKCLPSDRLFSIDELLDLMRQAEPRRVIKEMSARAQFHKFQRDGEVYRVMRSEARNFLWAMKRQQCRLQLSTCTRPRRRYCASWGRSRSLRSSSLCKAVDTGRRPILASFTGTVGSVCASGLGCSRAIRAVAGRLSLSALDCIHRARG